MLSMEQAYVREWCTGLMWRGSHVFIAFWHQVTVLLSTYTSSSLNVIKTCKQSLHADREWKRGNESSRRQLSLREREKGWLKNKVPQSWKVEPIFSSCRRTHVGSRCLGQLWWRGEMVLQHMELLPPQVTPSITAFSSWQRMGQNMPRQGQFSPGTDGPPLSNVSTVSLELNENVNEEQRSRSSRFTDFSAEV